MIFRFKDPNLRINAYFFSGIFLFEFCWMLRNFIQAKPFVTGITFSSFESVSFLSSFFPLWVSLYLFFAIVSSVLLMVFKPSKPIIYFFCLGCYFFFYSATYYPQVFSGVPLIQHFVYFYFKIAHPAWSFISAFVFVVVLFWPWWRRPVRLSSRFLGCVLLCLIVLFFFHINQPYANSDLRNSAEKKVQIQEDHNLILIGIDGLRKDALSPYTNNPKYPFLNKFLNESARFPNTISHVARTMPTYLHIFRGQDAQTSGVRSSFQKNVWDSDVILKDSLLENLKKDGYRTELVFSDSDYTFFSKGKVLDQVDAPNTGPQNIFLPLFFQDHFLFSFANNSIGRYVLPQIFDNGAFYEIYWPQTFLAKVKKTLRRSLAVSKSVIVSHYTKLHWPGAFQYPYYLRRAGLDEPFPFSYSSALGAYGGGNNGVKFNQELYNKGVEQVVDNYLEPLLAFIYRNEIEKHSVIALYSDHGEALFSERSLPLSKVPSHGSLLILEDDSNSSFLAIRYQSPENKIHTEAVAISAILPLMTSNQKADSSYIRAESDYWFGQLIPDGRKTDGEIHSNFELTGLRYYLKESAFSRTLVKRTRSLFYKNLRFSIYSGSDGYKWEIRDQNSLMKAKINFAEVQESLRKFMLFYRKDVESGFLPQLKISNEDFLLEGLSWVWSFNELHSRFIKDPNKYGSLYALRVEVEIRNFNLSHLPLVAEVMRDRNIANFLKSQIAGPVLEHCILFPESIPYGLDVFFNTELSQELLEKQTICAAVKLNSERYLQSVQNLKLKSYQKYFVYREFFNQAQSASGVRSVASSLRSVYINENYVKHFQYIRKIQTSDPDGEADLLKKKIIRFEQALQEAESAETLELVLQQLREIDTHYLLSQSIDAWTFMLLNLAQKKGPSYERKVLEFLMGRQSTSYFLLLSILQSTAHKFKSAQLLSDVIAIGGIVDLPNRKLFLKCYLAQVNLLKEPEFCNDLKIVSARKHEILDSILKRIRRKNARD